MGRWALNKKIWMTVAHFCIEWASSSGMGKEILPLTWPIHVKHFSGFSVIRGEPGDVLTGLVEPEPPHWVLPGSISLEPHLLAVK